MILGFDEEKYLDEQSKHILERVEQFNKLYLELGGKLLHDTHAARVLPGYNENTKIKLLQKLRDDLEVIICVYSGHIENNKLIGDSGINYEMATFRLIDDLRKYNLHVNSVVITRYEEKPLTDIFIRKLKRRNIKTYKHRAIKGYPTEVDIVVSEDGYGKNPYIPTTKKIVAVTAPGPGSGKLGTCLSELYHEFAQSNNASYAKFETFPIWNMPLKHPVNVAYESATADLKDINLIDSFHMDAYNEIAVNYNRDIESFPLLKKIMEKITGKESIYKSPTDMGVNKVAYGIIDDNIIKEAAKQEVIRRYLIAKSDYIKGNCDMDVIDRLKILMESLEIKEEDKKTVIPARQKAEKLKPTMKVDEVASVIAIELDDGKIITGKTTELMESSATVMLNALKYLANINDDMLLLAPLILQPITELKSKVNGEKDSLLNLEEVLIALSICAVTNTMAEKALSKIDLLKNCKAHSTTIISLADEQMFAKLGIQITSDPVFPNTNLYYNM